MASFVTIDASAMRRMVGRVNAGKAVLKAPLAGDRGPQTAKIMRTGPKGIYRQFVDQTEYKNKLSIPWIRTKPFGTRKAPRKTMLRSGSYRGAFLGGPGSITKMSAKAVEIGVDGGLFPQVKIHQSSSVATRIKPKNKITKGPHRGEFKMRFFLGMNFGVWFTHKRMSKGVLVPRRRVSVSSENRKAVAAMIAKKFGEQLRAPKLTISGAL